MNSSLKPQVNQVLLAVLPSYFLAWWHLNELCQLRQIQSLIFFLFTSRGLLTVLRPRTMPSKYCWGQLCRQSC